MTIPARLTLEQYAVEETLRDLLLGRACRACRVLADKSDELTRSDIKKIVQQTLKRELPDELQLALKKQLKANDFESLVTEITSRALAKFFEIMFTRRSTWQNQLKRG